CIALAILRLDTHEFPRYCYQEIALILVAALVVFGPTRLPEVAGQAARFLKDARKMMMELSGEFEKNAGVKEFKSAIEGELAGIQKDLSDAGIGVRNDLQKAAGTVNSTVKSAAATASGKTPAKTTTNTSKTTASTVSTGSAAKPRAKATKEDPFAGLVALPDVAPKSRRALPAPVLETNGHHEADLTVPSRETSEAVMRARERRAAAGYNQRVQAF
ncbi:MAG TPA: twin-arginine translocase TatA/TatE family subunit, partial [Thermomicrobiales bacterium]|nr:twin-arginine translocase TatA/TatE family subunit [Thermomicrobiales bacterium]